jgi:ornithine decarboxylase
MHAQIKALAEGNAMDGVDGDEGAFFVGDLGEVWKAWKSWVTELSRVELFYGSLEFLPLLCLRFRKDLADWLCCPLTFPSPAVKCNPDPLVIQLLALLGTGFDCASQAEILTVLSLPSPPPPSRIIFANPCKPVSFIRSAKTLGVDAMTFDNTDELLKIAKHHPTAKLVLRILTDDSKSLCRLGLKFGAPVESCEGLLQLARELGLNVIGVSFHVGSGCKDPQMFDDAVLRAKAVFNLGREKGYAFSLLDIGGGFEKENFGITAKCLSRALDEHFPREMGVRIIGEPGRFLVSSAFTLATSVIARRAQASAVLGGMQATTPESEGSERMLGNEGDKEREREREEREMELMTSSIASLDGSLEQSGTKHVGDAGTEEGPKVMCQ